MATRRIAFLPLPLMGVAVRIPHRYAERMSPQIAVRLPVPLLDEIDALVTGGRFETRAEAIRAGIEALVDQERRARIGRDIVEGYRRLPQAEDIEEELGAFPPPGSIDG